MNFDNGLIALLDLPKHSQVGLDGHVIVIQSNDFVGIQQVPSNIFHLVTASAASKADGSNNISHSHCIGLVIFQEDPVCLIRRYDPLTEELSDQPIDTVTKQNLLQQVYNQQLASPSRLLSYHQVVLEVSSQQQQENLLTSSSPAWMDQTRYINQSNILQLRGLVSGDKIVPGSYNDDDDDDSTDKWKDEHCHSRNFKNNNNHKENKEHTILKDGKSIHYPPIPVIDPNLSLATHKHIGTQRYLMSLTPQQRTRLFLDEDDPYESSLSSSSSSLGRRLLDRVVQEYYQNSWKSLLGDVQLSFVCFLYLHCLSSLQHWKDLLALLSLGCDGSVVVGGDSSSCQDNLHKRSQQQQSQQQQQQTPSSPLVNNYFSELYQGLIQLLPYQLSCIDDKDGFLEDGDQTGGNFLLPSLERLYRHLIIDTHHKNGMMAMVVQDGNAITKFHNILARKFPHTFSENNSPRIQLLPFGAEEEEITEEEDKHSHDDGPIMKIIDAHNDEDDGPIIVPWEDVEASMARSATADATRRRTRHPNTMIPADIQTTYPLLLAAIQPNEDILMTCARALDDKTDVSLVREAAAYLENIEEQHTPHDHTKTP